MRAQFGNVRQLPSGRWQARWKEADRYYSARTARGGPLTFPTAEAARTWLNEHREEILNRTTFPAPQRLSTSQPKNSDLLSRQLRSLSFVAEYLDVDERTVRRYIAAGHLKAFRLGAGVRPTIRIDLADLDAFITPAEPDEVSP